MKQVRISSSAMGHPGHPHTPRSNEAEQQPAVDITTHNALLGHVTLAAELFLHRSLAPTNMKACKTAHLLTSCCDDVK